MEQKNVEKISRETIGNHLWEYELNLVGKTKNDILINDMWRFDWAITRKQYDEFKMYSVYLLKRTFRCNLKKAFGIFDWFYSQFGLRIKN